MPDRERSDIGEVFFEIQVIGAMARVSAIHARTNTEVVVVTPATLPRFSQQQAALQKLRYVLAKAGLAGGK